MLSLDDRLIGNEEIRVVFLIWINKIAWHPPHVILALMSAYWREEWLVTALPHYSDSLFILATSSVASC
jgi:hypothetical protein